VQNNVSAENLGSATSVVTFFRSLGGAAGVSVLGAVLSNHVADLIVDGLRGLGIDPSKSGSGSASISNLSSLPKPIAQVVSESYGDAIARLFLIAGILAAVSLLAIVFIKEVALKTTTNLQERMATAGATASVEQGSDGEAAGDESAQAETPAPVRMTTPKPAQE